MVEDVHNFGPDYDRTLMAWYLSFEEAWPDLRVRYTEEFRRAWRYYLLSCAAAFRARFTQLFQVILARPGTPRRHLARLAPRFGRARAYGGSQSPGPLSIRDGTSLGSSSAEG